MRAKFSGFLRSRVEEHYGPAEVAVSAVGRGAARLPPLSVADTFRSLSYCNGRLGAMSDSSPARGQVTAAPGVDAAAGVEQRALQIRSMFASIAPRYDLLNHVLSLNVDRLWRRRAVDRVRWERAPAGAYLDNCAGTLDLSIELARRDGFEGRVVGSDFTYPMLHGGLHKLDAVEVDPVCADALHLPYADRSFDGATVGFGVRNLADLDAGLAEMARVLRTGSRLVILEFTTPHWQPFRGLYLLYFLRVLPLVGRLVSRHGSAYTYLPESVLRFPEPVELGRRMEAAGFRDVGWERVTGGVVAIHWGERA
jgi:demethylmenaquinone methyltransferase/2-methoxy-6-polyprenyl-1,4-benzoquinol methylase